MGKLIYKTKPPKRGYINYESFSTHELDFGEKIPANESKALSLVDNKIRQLIMELDQLGYDMTKARFSIGIK